MHALSVTPDAVRQAPRFERLAGDLEELVRAVSVLRRPRVDQIIVFGSYPGGTARADSDVDLLVVIDDDSASPDLANARSGLLRAIRGIAVAVDPVVRTGQQFADRKDVPGCIEHAACTGGSVLFVREDASNRVAVRSPDEVRLGNVYANLEEASTMLGIGAVRAFRPAPEGVPRVDYFAWRAVRAGIAARLAFHGLGRPQESAPDVWLASLQTVDQSLAIQLRTFVVELPIDLESARISVLLTIESFSDEPRLEQRCRELARYVQLPLEQLPAVRPPGALASSFFAAGREMREHRNGRLAWRT